MIVSSLKKLISTTVASKQKHCIIHEQENIVEENYLLQMKFGHIHFHKNVIIIAMAFGSIMSFIQ